MAEIDGSEAYTKKTRYATDPLDEKPVQDEDQQSESSPIESIRTTTKPDPEKGERDLELARTVSSVGPPYSIYSKSQKHFVVFMAAWGALFSSFAANLYFPALNTLARELHVSDELVNLTITSYMIFQALAPSIYGDLADATGRRPTYIIGFVIFLAANLGLALQSHYVALFILRCLQSTGSSGAIALGNGVVADVSAMTERGTYMGLVISGVMVGSAIGPILGGLLSQFLGWRSLFWFLVILTVIYLSLLLLFFPETGRHIVGNGSMLPQPWNRCIMDVLKIRRIKRELKADTVDEAAEGIPQTSGQGKWRWPNPLHVFAMFLEKDVAIVLFYNSLVYVAYFDVITSFPALLQEIFHFNDLQVGLCFIPYGAGCVIASVTTGKLIDVNYRRVARMNNIPISHRKGTDLRNFPIEKARVQVMVPVLAVGIAAIICYGWVLQIETTLAAPLVMHFVIGLCMTGAYDVMSVMLVDFYPESPATATAANNLARGLMGAAGTAIINIMIEAMGRGWCFTFIGLVLAFFSPLLYVEVRYGARWREQRRQRKEGGGGGQ